MIPYFKRRSNLKFQRLQNLTIHANITFGKHFKDFKETVYQYIGENILINEAIVKTDIIFSIHRGCSALFIVLKGITTVESVYEFNNFCLMAVRKMNF